MNNCIFAGSIPTDASSLQYWNAYKVNLEQETQNGLVYHVLPKGFMTQFLYTTKIVSSLSIEIIYRNLSSQKIQGEIVVYTTNKKDIHLYFYLPPNRTFTTYSVTFNDFEGISAQVAVEIHNNTNKAVDFAQLGFSGSLTDDTSNKIDTDEFIKKCVLFGLDVNKPKLR